MSYINAVELFEESLFVRIQGENCMLGMQSQFQSHPSRHCRRILCVVWHNAAAGCNSNIVTSVHFISINVNKNIISNFMALHLFIKILLTIYFLKIEANLLRQRWLKKLISYSKQFPVSHCYAPTHMFLFLFCFFNLESLF